MKLHSLTFKIPLIMGLSITLSIFVITVIMFLISLKSVDIAAQNGFETTAAAYEGTANLWIEHQKITIQNFATNDSIVNYLLSPDEYNTQLANDALKNFKNYRSSFLYFSVLNNEGKILLDSDIEYVGASDPDFYLYKRNLKNEKMGVARSPINNKPVFKIYSDVLDSNGNIIGILLCNIDWEDFMNHSIYNFTLGKTGDIMFIDENKNIVAHKDENKILSNIENYGHLKNITDFKKGVTHYKVHFQI